ncbi:transmembrane protein 107 isoform X4 [Trichosurus vulpecula]|uniref:transmembrane protein 107 isoform X4 n=1 Tax=Trichosurus vulpecula TaxID=9337 RepID=UPI00186AD2A4|nr:transmembrane protein 107 isoform X4 [Trichosurus vulpecula]
MGRISGLVPSRFLTLLAHLVIVVTIFWTRDDNVQASLPPHFTSEEYEKEDSKSDRAALLRGGVFGLLRLRELGVLHLLVHLRLLQCPSSFHGNHHVHRCLRVKEKIFLNLFPQTWGGRPRRLCI